MHILVVVGTRLNRSQESSLSVDSIVEAESARADPWRERNNHKWWEVNDGHCRLWELLVVKSVAIPGVDDERARALRGKCRKVKDRDIGKR